MKLAALYLDRVAVIPGAGVPGTPSELRGQTFIAAEGWDIRFLGEVFTLQREGMPAPVYVRGIGATYVLADADPLPMPPSLASAAKPSEQPRKGKR